MPKLLSFITKEWKKYAIAIKTYAAIRESNENSTLPFLVIIEFKIGKILRKKEITSPTISIVMVVKSMLSTLSHLEPLINSRVFEK